MRRGEGGGPGDKPRPPPRVRMRPWPTVPGAAALAAEHFPRSLRTGRGRGERLTDGLLGQRAAVERGASLPVPAGRSGGAAMPLHKVPVGLWRRLWLREGICSRLPPHYLRSLQEARAPAPVHYRPRGVGAGAGAGGRRERVQDVPIPVYRPPEAQLGLWGGEGWVVGYRYVGDDKVGGGGPRPRSSPRPPPRPAPGRPQQRA